VKLSFIIVGALVIAAAVPVIAQLLRKQRGAAAPRARALLTPNELEFLDRLERAVPELRFFAQVSMGALLEPSIPRADGGEYMRQRSTFSQKVVDFVAHSRTEARVIAIIELDDRTHNGARDRARDAMLASAGYKTIRWNSRAKPDTQDIRAQLLASQAGPATGAPASSLLGDDQDSGREGG
jgi:hypothetical protein